MRQWFDSLAPRERVMVGIAAVVVVLAVLYAGVWEPLNHGVAHLSQQVKQQRELVSWLHETAPKIRALRQATHRNAPKEQNAALLSVIDKTSKAAGMGGMVKRIQPQGDNSVQVWIENATFNDMLDWVYRLQNRYGVEVKSASMQPGNQAGQVHGNLRLIRPTGSGS